MDHHDTPSDFMRLADVVADKFEKLSEKKALEYVIKYIISVLCRTQGRAKAGDIIAQGFKVLLKYGINSAEKLFLLCQSLPQCFEVHAASGLRKRPGAKAEYEKYEIEATNAVQLCEQHALAPGSCPMTRKCGRLHICKFFLLSDTCDIKGLNRDIHFCLRGHNIRSVQNCSVLKHHFFDHLTMQELRTLLHRRSARTRVTRPQVCREYYCNQDGCKMGDKCPCLHICRSFLLGECMYGDHCYRSHDLTQSSVTSCLEQFSVNIEDLSELMQDNEQDLQGSSWSTQISSSQTHRLSNYSVDNRLRPDNAGSRTDAGDASSTKHSHSTGERESSGAEKDSVLGKGGDAKQRSISMQDIINTDTFLPLQERAAQPSVHCARSETPQSGTSGAGQDRLDTAGRPPSQVPVTAPQSTYAPERVANVNVEAAASASSVDTANVGAFMSESELSRSGFQANDSANAFGAESSANRGSVQGADDFLVGSFTAENATGRSRGYLDASSYSVSASNAETDTNRTINLQGGRPDGWMPHSAKFASSLPAMRPIAVLSPQMKPSLENKPIENVATTKPNSTLTSPKDWEPESVPSSSEDLKISWGHASETGKNTMESRKNNACESEGNSSSEKGNNGALESGEKEYSPYQTKATTQCVKIRNNILSAVKSINRHNIGERSKFQGPYWKTKSFLASKMPSKPQSFTNARLLPCVIRNVCENLEKLNPQNSGDSSPDTHFLSYLNKLVDALGEKITSVAKSETIGRTVTVNKGREQAESSAEAGASSWMGESTDDAKLQVTFTNDIREETGTAGTGSRLAEVVLEEPGAADTDLNVVDMDLESEDSQICVSSDTVTCARREENEGVTGEIQEGSGEHDERYLSEGEISESDNEGAHTDLAQTGSTEKTVIEYNHRSSSAEHGQGTATAEGSSVSNDKLQFRVQRLLSKIRADCKLTTPAPEDRPEALNRSEGDRHGSSIVGDRHGSSRDDYSERYKGSHGDMRASSGEGDRHGSSNEGDSADLRSLIQAGPRDSADLRSLIQARPRDNADLRSLIQARPRDSADLRSLIQARARKRSEEQGGNQENKLKNSLPSGEEGTRAVSDSKRRASGDRDEAVPKDTSLLRVAESMEGKCLLDKNISSGERPKPLLKQNSSDRETRKSSVPFPSKPAVSSGTSSQKEDLSLTSSSSRSSCEDKGKLSGSHVVQEDSCQPDDSKQEPGLKSILKHPPSATPPCSSSRITAASAVQPKSAGKLKAGDKPKDAQQSKDQKDAQKSKDLDKPADTDRSKKLVKWKDVERSKSADNDADRLKKSDVSKDGDKEKENRSDSLSWSGSRGSSWGSSDRPKRTPPRWRSPPPKKVPPGFMFPYLGRIPWSDPPPHGSTLDGPSHHAGRGSSRDNYSGWYEGSHGDVRASSAEVDRHGSSIEGDRHGNSIEGDRHGNSRGDYSGDYRGSHGDMRASSVEGDRHGRSIEGDRHGRSIGDIRASIAEGDRHGSSIEGDRHGSSRGDYSGRYKGSHGDMRTSRAEGDRRGSSIEGDRHGRSIESDRHSSSIEGDRHSSSIEGDRHSNSIEGDRRGGSVEGDRHGSNFSRGRGSKGFRRGRGRRGYSHHSFDRDHRSSSFEAKDWKDDMRWDDPAWPSDLGKEERKDYDVKSNLFTRHTPHSRLNPEGLADDLDSFSESRDSRHSRPDLFDQRSRLNPEGLSGDLDSFSESRDSRHSRPVLFDQRNRLNPEGLAGDLDSFSESRDSRHSRPDLFDQHNRLNPEGLAGDLDSFSESRDSRHSRPDLFDQRSRLNPEGLADDLNSFSESHDSRHSRRSDGRLWRGERLPLEASTSSKKFANYHEWKKSFGNNQPNHPSRATFEHEPEFETYLDKDNVENDRHFQDPDDFGRRRDGDLERGRDDDFERRRDCELERRRDVGLERRRDGDLERRRDDDLERRRGDDLERRRDDDLERRRGDDLERRRDDDLERHSGDDLERRRDDLERRRDDDDLERHRGGDLERHRDNGFERRMEPHNDRFSPERRVHLPEERFEDEPRFEDKEWGLGGAERPRWEESSEADHVLDFGHARVEPPLREFEEFPPKEGLPRKRRHCEEEFAEGREGKRSRPSFLDDDFREDRHKDWSPHEWTEDGGTFRSRGGSRKGREEPLEHPDPDLDERPGEERRVDKYCRDSLERGLYTSFEAKFEEPFEPREVTDRYEDGYEPERFHDELDEPAFPDHGDAVWDDAYGEEGGFDYRSGFHAGHRGEARFRSRGKFRGRFPSRSRKHNISWGRGGRGVKKYFRGKNRPRSNEPR